MDIFFCYSLAVICILVESMAGGGCVVLAPAGYWITWGGEMRSKERDGMQEGRPQYRKYNSGWGARREMVCRKVALGTVGTSFPIQSIQDLQCAVHFCQCSWLCAPDPKLILHQSSLLPQLTMTISIDLMSPSGHLERAAGLGPPASLSFQLCTFLFIWVRGSHSVVQAGLELLMLLIVISCLLLPNG